MSPALSSRRWRGRLAPLVHDDIKEVAEEREGAGADGGQQGVSKAPEVAREQLPGVEGEERAEAADGQLDPEGHGHFLVLEPAGEHGALGDDQGLGPGAEDEAADEDKRDRSGPARR